MGSPDLVETTLLAHIQAIELTRGIRDPEAISDVILRTLMRLGNLDPKFGEIADYFMSNYSSKTFDPPETLRGGEFVFKRPERLLTSVKFPTAEPQTLQPLRSRIFEILLTNLGRVVSNQSLLDYAWGTKIDHSGDFGLVKVHIHHLRKNIDHPGINISGKMEDSHILSIHGNGYKLRSCDSY